MVVSNTIDTSIVAEYNVELDNDGELFIDGVKLVEGDKWYMEIYPSNTYSNGIYEVVDIGESKR